MTGIVAYGAYVPRRRLSRQVAYDANRWFAPGLRGLAQGERAVANWDEDSITMGVEAARDALHGLDAAAPRHLYFASTTLPFRDRQNAGVIRAALHLDERLVALDVTGSLRAGTSALLTALGAAAGSGPALVVAADRRPARVASSQELQYGDGAAALLCGTDGVVARLLGHHAAAVDFVDHFRGAEAEFDYAWEERWVRDEGYLGLVPPALRAALGRCGLDGAAITHFLVPSLLPAVPRQLARLVGVPEAAVRDPLSAVLGDTGTAHPLVMLAHALETAKPGDRLLVAGFGHGVDVLVFEVTPEIGALPRRRGVSGWLGRRREERNYLRFLALQDLLPLERGMRAEFDKKTALSILWRKRDMLYGLVGGRCRACGTVQFPKSAVCVSPECRAVDSQEDRRMADLPATVVTWSADALTYSPDPPSYYGMIAFAEGGRLTADFTDCDAEEVRVGAPMRMTFRIREVDAARGGFKRYFWKAAPA
jgi:3-hydroxy-3-methylglutaryl CoA synthase